MLTLYHDGQQLPIQNTEYYVRELASGLDEVIFDISIYDPIYAILQEEEQITDRGGQRYLVKQIDAGADSAKVVCQLDLDAWKSAMHVEYSNGSATAYETINAVKPSGWTVLDLSHVNIRRTITGNYTPLEICAACVKTYRVYVRWDNLQKVCTILPQTMGDPVGSFATRQLNLKEINYKGKSNDFATRLYPYGKRNDAGEALTIQGATISGSVYPYPYVENRSYANKVVSVYWIDERYTVVQNLYDDAVAKLAELAKPVRSYVCSIVDLQATNPEIYGNLSFDLFTVATLIDDIKNTALDYMVLERHIYPYHPDQNEVMFDSVPLKITSEITGIVDTVENTNSDFRQIMQQEIDLATSWLLNSDSHIYIVKDSEGLWKELLFLDGTQDPATATRVMRLNSSGLGFSKTGVNGPFTNAFVFDAQLGGHLIADFITAGTMLADRVRAGTLASVNNSIVFDLTNNTLTCGNKALRITAGNFTLDANGNVTMTGTVTAQAGSKIGPWDVGANAITYNNGSYGVSGLYFGTSGISLGSTFKVSNTGVLEATGATIGGTVTATEGAIGGWTLAANNLHSGSGASYVALSSDTSGTYAMWAGNGTAASAPFRVSRAGVLTATGADISGTVTATNGSIGGFTIDATSIRSAALTAVTSGAIGLSTVDFSRTIGGVSRSNLRLAIGSGFGVDEDGKLYAGAIYQTVSGVTPGGYNPQIIAQASIEHGIVSAGQVNINGVRMAPEGADTYNTNGVYVDGHFSTNGTLWCGQDDTFNGLIGSFRGKIEAKDYRLLGYGDGTKWLNQELNDIWSAIFSAGSGGASSSDISALWTALNDTRQELGLSVYT